MRYQPRPRSSRQPLRGSDRLGRKAVDVASSHVKGGPYVRSRSVPGFVNYAALRNGDGGVTVTVCEDKAGTDESSRRAAEWVKENVSATAGPPAIVEGDTVLQF